jgi:hypothetical protein
MIDHEPARASLERQLRRANPDADVQAKRMRRGIMGRLTHRQLCETDGCGFMGIQ